MGCRFAGNNVGRNFREISRHTADVNLTVDWPGRLQDASRLSSFQVDVSGLK